MPAQMQTFGNRTPSPMNSITPSATLANSGASRVGYSIQVFAITDDMSAPVFLPLSAT
jgi:hypothetical protein